MSDPKIKWIDVTPDLAAKWLALNIENNRSLRRRAVERYARDMKAGRWLPCGDPIRFDEQGRLIDGQHRLHAVLSSGVTVRMVVLRGLSTAAFGGIDNQTPRHTRDFVTLQNATRVVAAARVAMAYERSAGASVLNSLSSRQEELAFIDDNEEALLQSVTLCQTHGRSVLTPSLVAFCHFILAKKDRAAADLFIGKLLDGENVSGPVYLLRERLLDETKTSKLTNQQKVYLVFRAWNAFRAKERISKLQLPRGADAAGAPIDLTTVAPK